MTTAAPTRDDLAKAAGWYAAHGWAVFPLIPNSKRPAVERWEEAATTDLDRVASFWASSAFNIGIACGPSNLLVVDLDTPKDDTDRPPEPFDLPGVVDGADVLAVLAEQHGQPFPYGTHSVTTASGGMHLYFTQPDGGDALRNTSGRLGWRIDTRGHGGYVVAAGSVVDGRRYRTVCAARPALLPGWIATALAAPKAAPMTPSRPGLSAYARAALSGELDAVLAAKPGTRNAALNTAAFALGQLVAAGLLDRTQVETALTVAATHIGLGDTETAATIASGLDSGATQPRRTA